MDRRKFIKSSAIAAIAGATGLQACSDEDTYSRLPHGGSTSRRKSSEEEGEVVEPIQSVSIFVASDRHEMGSGNYLPDLMQKIKDEAPDRPRLVLLGGDYVGGGGNMTPEFPISDLYKEVYDKMPLATCDALFTYGSHDNCCTDGYTAFYSGPRRYDGFHVYGVTYVQVACATDADAAAAIALRQGLLRAGSDFEEFEDDDLLISQNGYGGIDAADRYGKSAESSTKSFLEWADSLTDNDPIVVMSHVPLHANRNDNYGGLTWFEALSKVAGKHDVIFLWGHNHTLEEKASDKTDREDKNLKDRFLYLLTPADLLTPGDKMDVQGDSETGTVEKELNFIYANAGYIKLGYGTMITFSGDGETFDTVTFHRYAIDKIDPETEIGFTGKTNPCSVKLQKI